MSLLNSLLSKAKKADIGFGVHENCVLLSVSNDVRKNKEEVILARNCYTKFGIINANNEITSEREIYWMNLDHTKEKVDDFFKWQLEQLTNIVDTFVPPTEEADIWDQAFDKILEAAEVELTKEALSAALKDKAKLEKITDLLYTTYVEILSSEASATPADKRRVRFKVVYDNKGQYLGAPKYGNVIEDGAIKETSLKITKNDEENKVKSTAISSSAFNPASSAKI